MNNSERNLRKTLSLTTTIHKYNESTKLIKRFKNAIKWMGLNVTCIFNREFNDYILCGILISLHLKMQVCTCTSMKK